MTTQREDAAIPTPPVPPPSVTVPRSRPVSPPETVGINRLDLRTDEATMVIPDDTPPPLTAVRLASVRRVAGARLFPDSTNLPGHDDGWEAWAEGVADPDAQMAQLDANLAPGHPRLLRLLPRRWTGQGRRRGQPGPPPAPAGHPTTP